MDAVAAFFTGEKPMLRVGRPRPVAAQRRATSTDVRARLVVLGEHADGADPLLSGRAGDPDRDLAAVGDQDTCQGAHSYIRRHQAARRARSRPFRAAAGSRTG
jgi:hypothetical protein